MLFRSVLVFADIADPVHAPGRVRRFHPEGIFERFDKCSEQIEDVVAACGNNELRCRVCEGAEYERCLTIEFPGATNRRRGLFSGELIRDERDVRNLELGFGKLGEQTAAEGLHRNPCTVRHVINLAFHAFCPLVDVPDPVSSRAAAILGYNARQIKDPQRELIS